ncbi:glycosyltransferase family 4 protein [Methylococcus sp. EFPC2]|uniref:glycosyltransferase family 4 protein n=1 Tax=Methylococcus sp. EFPC2 TaxID=2812648 RepID=UPI00196860D5|nr:glycosyltransferase family 4 protein [Methylococcus sp. EFPC2]QSA98463.1 glycosyltransferase family 4 protein [Methylococcus sp. EFPC2]
MRVLAFTRYTRIGASSRLRIYQYLPMLESSGFQVTVAPLVNDQYIINLYAGRPKSFLSMLQAYFERFLWIRRAAEFDVVWVEKEFLPWLPAWIELWIFSKRVRLIADYDDAVFHYYDLHPSAIIRKLLGDKIDSVMRRADIVVAGNGYLAERALETGAKDVEIVPTVVDTARYVAPDWSNDSIVTVGWIGSPATAHYLQLIAPVINHLAEKTNVRFVAVGANAEQLNGLPISVLPWSEAHEVEMIQQFDIGIMPLPDEPFTRGKCGYKLIQCMACGIPVVASPVGANAEIVRDGIDGFWANSQADWLTVLNRLIDDPSLRKRMGTAGRERVVTSYSLSVTADRLTHLILSVAEPR